MKKLLFVLLAATLTTGAFAQSAPKKVKTTVHKEELKGDIKEKRDDQKTVRHDLADGKLKKAKEDHKAVAKDQKEVNKDAAKLKKDGVDHPKAEAKKEIRQENK